ncbi:MAG: PAS domain-containing protein [Saprospiraceae bacterium]|nr:PAS domain-containing protein [Saprospiraceae bacterium]
MTKIKSNSEIPKHIQGKLSRFPVVAIGASAGGLEAMMELLKYLPPDTGMAFIYVQHLSPDHKSMLTEILAKKTKMKVQEIDDMDKIKPDNVFVIPYNKGIEVTDGHIKLIPRSESSAAISIDILFSSLAQAQKGRVIGIVLSGSASDGTIGIKDIKHEGGLTFAQDDTAKFTSMPHSAIATGAVDFILSPKEMAFELARLSKHPFVKSEDVKTNSEDLIDNSDPDLKVILNQLHKSTGVNFSAYKMNTIKRRIIRRMLLYKITTLKEYTKLLTQKSTVRTIDEAQSGREELDILYQDLLINVTSFFRDTDTHKYLKESLFPKLLKRKISGESLRIWVPACATGEEAYSIAMILLEIQGSQSTAFPVQIFATDLSEQAINKARIGVYTKQELETVSPKRIQRFFTKTDDGFRVNKAVRDMCVFAQHNILSDPPFSRLDFISCCNLFIYLDTAAQKKAVNTFHYSLNNNGYLMLGKSENISHSANLFTSSNKKYKIFSRKLNTGFQRLPELSPRFVYPDAVRNNVPVAHRNIISNHNSSVQFQVLDKTIDDILVSEFMPASVVIDHQLEIIQFRGITDLFLTHPKGKATFNILKMARPEIAFELRNAITKAIKTKQRIRKTGIELKIDSEIKVISIEVVPLKIEWNDPLILILFTEHEQTEIYSKQVNRGNNSPAKDKRILKLEQELATAHDDALVFTQEQEAFTEELQSAHEEVVSSNEELQTLNEELETSKEEIESANEELITTNQELQTRNDLLNESYEYSNAIVSTMHEPMLVLGKDLRVKSANKAFFEKFSVTEEQTLGVLLYDLGNKQWNIPALRKLLEDIIPGNSHFYNYEVRHTFLNLGEKIMSLNASRVVQNTRREQLILLIIADITEVRNLIEEKELREKELLTIKIREQNSEKNRLEKAVSERTQELKEANHSLERKNKELVNMNKELEAFTYVSSHDLQEPLRKLQIFAGLILDKETQNLSEKGKNYFLLIQQAAERMQRLIHDLLTFSRVKDAERTFEMTDLNIIIEEVKSELKETIGEKHAIIEVKDICDVNIIPFQFRQLMNNLFSNSLKFSKPNKPPHIKITSKHVKFKIVKVKGLLPQTEYCRITISDNGIGFKKEFSEKIFEVFQKLHGKEEYAGTGIGLAIVKKIVDNHNGIITAKSVVNRGAAFDIYLPVVQSGISDSPKNKIL